MSRWLVLLCCTALIGALCAEAKGGSCSQTIHNVSIGTEVIQTLSVQHTSDCCTACTNYPNDPNCAAFTFTTGKCELKAKVDGQQPCEGCSSGTIVAPTPPPTPAAGIPNGQGCLDSVSKNLPYCDASKSIDARVEDLTARLSVSEVISRLGSSKPAPEVPSVGLPAFNYRVEAIHGLEAYCMKLDSGLHCPTYFPIGAGMQATFNRSVFRSFGKVISTEARVWGNLHGLAKFDRPMGISIRSPFVNLLRDPRWGRSAEAGSECPHLVSEFGKAVVGAIQTRDSRGVLKAAAEVKHFAVYNFETNRESYNAVVSAFDWMDSYARPFAATLRDANASAYMCSYNAVNGTPACASRFLSQHTAREKWGFNGFVESDCDAVGDIANYPGFSNSSVDAAADGLNGGTDLNCGQTYGSSLAEAIARNKTTEVAARESFKRAIRPLFDMGLFDSVGTNEFTSLGVADLAGHQQAAVEASEQSLVLLKNDNNTLPFKPGSSVALIGPLALAQAELVGPVTIGPCPGSVAPGALGGGYKEDYSCVHTLNHSLRTRAHTVLVEPGCNMTDTSISDIPAAVAAAKAADVVVLAVGTGLSVVDEGEDLKSLRLPGLQEQLIRAVLSVRKPTVVLLIAGNSMGIEAWAPEAPAIVNAFIPSGTSAAAVMLDAVFGATNRWGKLPYTMYPSSYVNEVGLLDVGMQNRTYRYYSGEPIFPFGYGLSYSQTKLTRATTPGGPVVLRSLEDSAWLDLRLLSIGPRAGEDVVQLYMIPVEAHTGAPLPRRQLINFERVSLGASGSSTTVRFLVKGRELGLVDAGGTLALFPGKYLLEATTGVGTTVVTPAKVELDEKIIIETL